MQLLGRFEIRAVRASSSANHDGRDLSRVNPHVNPYENASGLDARIISEIQSNARITIQALAEICGKNRDTIRVHLRNMQQKGLVKRVGPDKGGHWEISLDFFALQNEPVTSPASAQQGTPVSRFCQQ